MRAVDARIAVLVSGAGTNLQALLDDPTVGPCIHLVISDNPNAPALERAREKGVSTAVLDVPAHPSPEDRDRALQGLLDEASIDCLVLAGFMRVLSADFVRAHAGRILNVHPSLLPAFPGAHGVRDALAWGAKVSGATVHLVDEEVDHGPIVLQEAVPVSPNDTDESLHARIQEVEHRMYPRAVRLLAEGRLKVEGRRVHILDAPGGAAT